jgi:hypothetical protein
VFAQRHASSPANPDLLPTFAPQARLIDAGKHKGHCALTQDQTNAMMIDLARQGLRVLRLKRLPAGAKLWPPVCRSKAHWGPSLCSFCFPHRFGRRHGSRLCS